MFRFGSQYNKLFFGHWWASLHLLTKISLPFIITVPSHTHLFSLQPLSSQISMSGCEWKVELAQLVSAIMLR